MDSWSWKFCWLHARTILLLVMFTKKRLFCWLSVYERDGGLVYARVSGSRGRKTNLLKLKAAVATLDIRDFYQGSKMSIEGGQLGRYHVCLLSLEPSFPLMGKQSDSVQLNKQKNRRKKKRNSSASAYTPLCDGTSRRVGWG